MFHKILLNDAVLPSVAGTAAGVALGSPILQTALINFAAAALVRLTKHLVARRRARRAASKS